MHARTEGPGQEGRVWGWYMYGIDGWGTTGYWLVHDNDGWIEKR